MLTNQSHDASFPVLLAPVSTSAEENLQRAEEQERWLSLMKKNGGLGFACRISQKAESPFDRQLFLECHLSIGSSVPSRVLLVKTEGNLQPSS